MPDICIHRRWHCDGLVMPCLNGATENRQAYACLCRNLSIKHELEKISDRTCGRTGLIIRGRNLQGHAGTGVFCLDFIRAYIERKPVVALFHQKPDRKIYELCKQDGKLLLLNVETGVTFRGHLMRAFMAAVILKLM